MEQHVSQAVEGLLPTCSLLLTLAMNPLRGKITTTVTIPASADGPRSYQSVKLEPSVTGTTGTTEITVITDFTDTIGNKWYHWSFLRLGPVLPATGSRRTKQPPVVPPTKC